MVALEEKGAPPAYTVTSNLQPSAHQAELRGHVLMFPKKFGFYVPKSSTKTTIIGPHRNQPLYALDSKEFSKVLRGEGGVPDLQLYSSISSGQDNVLAKVVFGPQPLPDEICWLVTLHPPRDVETTELFTGSAVKDKMHRYAWRFTVESDLTGKREDFEWRDSRHANLKSALGKRPIGGGWKLVRMTSDAHSNKGKSQGHDNWITDGKDVLAVCASHGVSLSKYWVGAFLGIGASGVLGKRWEVMVVITMYALMEQDLKRAMESS